MGEKENFIKIDNEFMADVETYTTREQFIYFILKGLANNINKATVVDTETIAGIMGLSSHSKNRVAIQNTLLLLEEKGLLLLYEDLLLTKQIPVGNIKLTKTYYGKLNEIAGERGFTKIYYSDVHKFICLEEKYKDLMFSIYFNIIHRIYDSVTSEDYSWVTIETIEDETGIDYRTITKYISVMKENEMLYYQTVKEGAKKDKNYYSRWTDREKLIEAINYSGDEDK
jgi:hypothetical protein